MLTLLIIQLLLCSSFADEINPNKELSPTIPLDPPHYTEVTFLENIKLRPQFVDYYAPWCAHCKTMTPAWVQLYRTLGGIGAKYIDNEETILDVGIAKVDCTKSTQLCADQHITGYPTLKFYKANNTEGIRYKGTRGYAELSIYVQKQLGFVEETSDEKALREKVELVPQEYTVDNFNRVVSAGHHFIKFFAPWCSHCQRMAPSWQKLANEYHGNKNRVTIASVDCTQHKALCTTHNIRGYPTLLWFFEGKLMDYKYSGDRSYENLRAFIEEMLKLHAPSPLPTAKPLYTAASVEDELEEPVAADENKENKIDSILEKVEVTPVPTTTPSAVTSVSTESFHTTVDKGIVVIKYFAPWCGHCKEMAGAYEELAVKFKDQSIVIAEVDCMEHRDLCSDQGISGFPTIIAYRGGSAAQTYDGERTVEEMTQFVTSLLREEL